jgi:hypothetical protein
LGLLLPVAVLVARALVVVAQLVLALLEALIVAVLVLRRRLLLLHGARLGRPRGPVLLPELHLVAVQRGDALLLLLLVVVVAARRGLLLQACARAPGRVPAQVEAAVPGLHGGAAAGLLVQRGLEPVHEVGLEALVGQAALLELLFQLRHLQLFYINKRGTHGEGPGSALGAGSTSAPLAPSATGWRRRRRLLGPGGGCGWRWVRAAERTRLVSNGANSFHRVREGDAETRLARASTQRPLAGAVPRT